MKITYVGEDIETFGNALGKMDYGKPIKHLLLDIEYLDTGDKKQIKLDRTSRFDTINFTCNIKSMLRGKRVKINFSYQTLARDYRDESIVTADMGFICRLAHGLENMWNVDQEILKIIIAQLDTDIYELTSSTHISMEKLTEVLAGARKFSKLEIDCLLIDIKFCENLQTCLSLMRIKAKE